MTKRKTPEEKALSNPVGRPPFYKTPKELQNKISEYFKNVPRIKKYTALGIEIDVPCPTITGLTLFLGFCDRHSFYAYEENKPEFSNTIKKARTFIEKHYEELLQNGNTTGAIFALKNFGWKDKHEISGDKDNPINLTLEFRNKIVEEIEKKEKE